ncbi:MAG: response regulator [Rubrivivax sp.]|nr:response regulator [Rubrivivax sp.]
MSSAKVLVLAFDSLDKAQGYYLGLYRLGRVLQQHAHRTVILCNRDEVQAVFDLCKKACFDDYVLYWPHSHDGPRLVRTRTGRHPPAGRTAAWRSLRGEGGGRRQVRAGIDGVALTQRLKASPHLASIPVVMMTGDASKAALLSSLEAGAAAFVVKPFTRESLTSKMQAVLSR